MFGGPGTFEIIIVAVLGILVIWPTCRIVGKAGFPPLLGLLMVIPLDNIALLLFLAFADWPALRQTTGQDLHDG